MSRQKSSKAPGDPQSGSASRPGRNRSEQRLAPNAEHETLDLARLNLEDSDDTEPPTPRQPADSTLVETKPGGDDELTFDIPGVSGFAGIEAEMEPGTSNQPNDDSVDDDTLNNAASGLIQRREHAERYETIATLGEGGMGRVYLVNDHDLKRRVALKVVLTDRRSHRIRFLDEAQILGQLEHPNIVPLHDIGTVADGRPYCTLRYVRGETLHDVIERLKLGDDETALTFSLTRRVQVLLQVGQAIAYAATKDVVHRDLKPLNIMLGSHGEVQVLDWGLAKILNSTSVADDTTLTVAIEEDPIQTLSGSSKLTLAGQIVGTPGYMSPEQARADTVDGKTDVYSLGTMLYELLTLERPRSGSVAAQVVLAARGVLPEPPRQRTPNRNIPAELDRICMDTLDDSPDARPSAEEFVARLQGWLEATADREKRHELAEEKASEGARKLDEYHRLKEDVECRTADVEAIRRRYQDWQSVDEKTELFTAEDGLEQARDQLMLRASEVVSILGEALAFEGDNTTARVRLSDYYWDRFSAAEAASHWRERDFYGSLVRQYHDGKYKNELAGDGSVALMTTPSGAEIWLSDLVERRRCLVPENARQLGTTPLLPVELGMGSYLAVIKRQGYRDVLYPVFVSRNHASMGHVKLYSDDDIGDEFLYVPAGSFIFGGDQGTRGYSGPRSEPEVDGFFIARYPVTNTEYMEFVNDPAVEQALERAPRRSPDGGYYCERDSDGLLILPEVDAEGDAWEPDDPVTSISALDADAYCAWRSRRDGLTSSAGGAGKAEPYRLPTDQEWEKAARGVDGRWFPWGKRFDASLCNMRASSQKGPNTVSIHAYPTDVSVYGVRGLGGNVRDWTATDVPDGSGDGSRQVRAARGGSFYTPPVVVRSAYCAKYPHQTVVGDVGFRLARTAPHG